MFGSLHMHFDAIVSIMASHYRHENEMKFSTKETIVPYVAHVNVCV